jgi:hypothetical protein
MSPESMDAEADSLEKTASAYLVRAKQLRAAARAIRALQSEPAVDSGLSRGIEYVTVAGMPSIETVTRHPGPIADNGAASRLAKELGANNLSELAALLGEPYPTVRAWNSRGSIPARVEPKIAKLRKSAKR